MVVQLYKKMMSSAKARTLWIVNSYVLCLARPPSPLAFWQILGNYQIDDLTRSVQFHSYTQISHDANSEMLNHLRDLHNHRDRRSVKGRHEIWHRESEVDDTRREEENKHMNNKRNVQLDALINPTMGPDCDFDDVNYVHDDIEMRRYHHRANHFEQTTTDG